MWPVICFFLMRVVVSLTTIPERDVLLMRNLQSLLRQTRVPDRIYLHVPRVSRKGQPYDWPHLRALARRVDPSGQVVYVNCVESDWGPITKLLPVLSLEPDPSTQLILVDDDVIYDPRLLERLLDPAFQRFPAVGFAGRNKRLEYQCNLATVNFDVHFLETFAGVRYARSLFPATSDAFAQWVTQMWQRQPLCVTTDDIIIGEWLHEGAHVPPVLIPFGDNAMRVDAAGTPELRDVNLTGNNAQCLYAFHPEWRLGSTRNQAALWGAALVVVGLLVLATVVALLWKSYAH